jgi:hypothetical protein
MPMMGNLLEFLAPVRRRNDRPRIPYVTDVLKHEKQGSLCRREAPSKVRTRPRGGLLSRGGL